MPVKPNKGCNIQNGGLWVWKGWQNIEGMGWDCQCQYPDAFGGPSCDDSYICLGGKFINKDGNPYNGDCECKNIGCTKDSDCQFGPCDKGVCVGQKSGLGGGFRKKCKVNIDCLYGSCNDGECTGEPPIGNGINPQCVPDGCWSKENPKSQWIKINNASGYCSCQPGFYSNGYLCLPIPTPTPIVPPIIPVNPPIIPIIQKYKFSYNGYYLTHSGKNLLTSTSKDVGDIFIIEKDGSINLQNTNLYIQCYDNNGIKIKLDSGKNNKYLFDIPSLLRGKFINTFYKNFCVVPSAILIMMNKGCENFDKWKLTLQN